MNIGLVLSGGMAKGAYQIGAMRALSKFISPEDIKFMSGASVGVLNGYAFATNRLDRAEQMWKDICSGDTRLLISQILRSSMLQQNIAALFDNSEPLNSDFYCTLMDITRRDVIYKNLRKVDRELIPKYLKASVAMPVYNRAVSVGGRSYFDGAMVDNIPVYPLMKHKLDYIICVYFDDVCYKFENSYFDNKVIKITFPDDGMLSQSIFFKRDNIDEMIKSGYKRTMFILKSVFADGCDNLESIYNSIEYMNSTYKNKSLRLTGDVLVTNLNKVAQKLAKRKIL